ncbi:FAD-dependent oxidoreductase [Hoyosella sp. G463]|uniref:ferredoxin--NADP(+) reductase n=1 Tax=Lolliginicoccus lacisalsi TaxID=2742202 RepID=A0A927JEL8_9ACTN|nr:FAD-dependent oxidoreductase [Lolliginicoccus lacisalsi]MBD8507420.1 FAD-dependent oxidoreductase [Lolliginicoccus lacisalsi]
MPHVVTQACCADASCVFACPVNCIHPSPDEPDFLAAEMLHIDPEACVDCGACVDACPVDAIVPHRKLEPHQQEFRDINAAFYQQPRPRTPLALIPISPRKQPSPDLLRVAIVGSGPAAMYAADELLKQRDVAVTMHERLDRPYGLARYGVAPDHEATRQVADLFDIISADRRLEQRFGTELGVDVTDAELHETHHAVIYATGASSDRRLGIPGEDLPGSVAATDFVAWYNGHPDHADRDYPLDHERVVIIGNGNVALDMARILTTDPERLAATSIAPNALEALRASAVREVVILGRRGPAQAAYTLPELLGLARKHPARLVIDKQELHIDAATELQRNNGTLAPATERKLAIAEEIALNMGEATADERRIVLRYLVSPREIHGDGRVASITAEHNELVEQDGRALAVGTGHTETLSTGLVIRSVGYRGTALPGVPFDEARGIIPNIEGRVTGADGALRQGSYVTGWIKRGPSGFIGTNKTCAKETVDHLIEDYNNGLLRGAMRR